MLRIADHQWQDFHQSRHCSPLEYLVHGPPTMSDILQRASEKFIETMGGTLACEHADSATISSLRSQAAKRVAVPF